MIYLHEPNLLFFKTKKTAGTSVEIALSCNATDQDIVTPILPVDEAKRAELGGRFPVNWAWDKAAEADYRARFEQWRRDGKLPRRWFGLRKGRLYPRRAAKYINHISPAELARIPEGAALMDKAFVVTMVRHPYEVAVSWAAHLHANRGGDFARLLDRAARHKPLNEAYVFGPRTPDFVIRFESLSDDLATLEARFGLALRDRLPVTKGAARKDRRRAADVLSPEQKTLIQASHARTFERFGYAP